MDKGAEGGQARLGDVMFRFRRHVFPLAMTLAAVAGVTAALFLLTSYVPFRSIAIVYLIPVLFAAMRWGLVPALVATAAGVLCADFFFYPPIYSLDIYDWQNGVELVMFGAVAIITSNLADGLKQQIERARRHEEETLHLYAFSRRLALCSSPADVYAAIEEHLAGMVSRPVVVIGRPALSAGEQRDEAASHLPVEIAAAVRALIDSPAEPLSPVVRDEKGTAWLLQRISAEHPDAGAVAIDLGAGPLAATEAVTRRATLALADAAATWHHLDIARVLAETNLRTENELLRDALLASVAHELRAPLTALHAAAGAVAGAPTVTRDPELANSAQILRQELERLTEVEALLETSRLARQGARLRRDWSEPADIIHAALDSKRGRLARHHVVRTIDPSLPLIEVDPVLVAEALGQVLDNAAKYSPPGSTIAISAQQRGNRVVLSVRDHGSGLTEDERLLVSKPQFRGARQAGIPGSGLGLWIAKTLVAANGGEIELASEGPGRGTTVTLRFPAPNQRS